MENINNRDAPRTESMNLGTRYESYSAASAFWLTQNYGNARRIPFALYSMPDERSGWDALSRLPFMEKAADTGKLITDRLAQYGAYEYERDGKRVSESFVAADDISADEFVDMQEIFEANGGRLLDRLLPNSERKPGFGAVSPAKLKLKESRGGAVYEIYTAENRASALACLREHPVDKKLYYLIVETPDGNFGRDIGGMFAG